VQVSFNGEAFRLSLRRQLEYVLRHEAHDILEDVVNELIHERLLELAEEELNHVGEEKNDEGPSLEDNISNIAVAVTPLDINHRYLVKEVLKKHMKELLRGRLRDGMR